ncbi:G-type lectin S-receptor-like serine/threonine-protein kinase At4g27290 isoform X2 [Telopea speciosissima]|uniref:G-type lectin S-receptor-like serine/threonine-protein kinase At4g27290 isoform X2 n=1 Tax=Telopea speciosissima TaxID=54955 RepID=UPI001CC3565D|nr:G-type lectin S-receptor-like serine/threonine-protein kinase At4g27290 isoform X2 [Telopea speciosissima]
MNKKHQRMVSLSYFLLLLLVFFCFWDLCHSASNTMIPNQSIIDGETLTSSGDKFVLGFFSPGTSKNRYIGIWYKHLPERTVIWVANRQNPLAGSTGVFTLRNDSNLVISDQRQNILWSTNLSMSSGNLTARLLDSGNFIIMEGDPNNPHFRILWQSFDHPSDTFLPGMKIGVNLSTGHNWFLSSWKNIEDPALGLFTFGVDTKAMNQFFIWPKTTGHPLMLVNIPEDKNYFPYIVKTEEAVYLEFSSLKMSRLVMETSGQLKLFTWLDTSQQWSILWSQPTEQCGVYAACGAYSICNVYKLPTCTCLPGFWPTSIRDWDLGDHSPGCQRKMALQCGSQDSFQHVENVNMTRSTLWLGSSSAEDCKAECLKSCHCSAYAYVDVGGGNFSCFLWSGDLVDIRDNSSIGEELYVRIAGSNSRSLGASLSTAKLILDAANFKEDENEVIEIPLLSFEFIEDVTSNFTESNKLGEGGFGPVYKGNLPGGQEIAVKRLAKTSQQGFEEFKNEVMLIAKLQHRNLVKLLGYCTHGDEKMLIYEYMPNKSLDSFLFDQIRSSLLNWEKRFNIILGIARGLLYLHQDSRLRIIHRDLKTSNILLDEEMNPKISDFGMARIFGGDQTQANTRRVVGTYGYMSPEYALDGLFSVKSDVYSFGIIVLEIISGKKNTGFYDSEHFLSLPSHAWRLWKEGNGLELMDPSLRETCNSAEVLKCIHVGLLCVQEDAIERPIMASVLVMLASEIATLPSPKLPPSFIKRSLSSIESSSCGPISCSLNEVTDSLVEGR